MEYLVRISIIVAFHRSLLLPVIRSDGLTVVHTSPYVKQLYLEIKTEESPAQTDPAIEATGRKCICDKITNNYYFWVVEGIESVDMDEIPDELRQNKNYDLFLKIYEKIENPRPETSWSYEYKNPYIFRKFVVDALVGDEYEYISVKEHAFLCLTRDIYSDDIIPFYVSKEYNLNHKGKSTPRLPGRFVFKVSNSKLVALAEEPSKIYENPIQNNFELHYLEIRKNHEPEKNKDRDPLCKLISREDPYNQHDRLCAKVLGSSYFVDRTAPILYSGGSYSQEECFELKISFRTEAGKREAGEKIYHEWMIACQADISGFIDEPVNRVYLSRAYNSSQLFVYRIISSFGGELFLENLSTNVNIVDVNNTPENF